MNIAQVGSRYLTLRRRSTKTGTIINAIKSRRNRSASDSVVHDKRLHKDIVNKVEIIVELRNLACPSSSTDSYVFSVLYENDNEDEKKWILHSTSEPELQSSSRICFNMSFIVNYIFERVQLLKIEVRDFSAGASLKNAVGNVIGSAIFKLDELIGAFGAQLRLPLSARTAVTTTSVGEPQAVPQGHYYGTVIVSGRLPEKTEPVILQFSGKNLEKRDRLFDETSVFFEVYRLENDETKTELYRSEAVKEHSRPIWRPLSLHLRKIADNRNRLLEISAMYRDEMNKTGLIGSFLTTYAKMKYGPGPENVYKLVNPHKKHKKGYSNSGKMELIKFSDVSFYSFLDYITSGTQLHLAIAVDFSWNLGNDQPKNSQTFDDDLQCAIKGIAGIVRDYSPSKMFPAFGLGAKIPPNFHESHKFHLNFGAESHCRGIDGILEAYRNASRKVMPSNRARYSDVVNTVTKMAESEGVRGLHYYVLIIFTSGGSIADSKELMNAIMKAAKMPISIIFLGVGSAIFEEFHRVAGSRKNVVVDGASPSRDFIECVELNLVIVREATFKQNSRRIAEQALHSVPWHLVSYMHKNNIAAKPPIQITRSPVFHSSNLIPDCPSQYDEQLYWNWEEHLRAKSTTPNAQRKYSENIERRPALTAEEFWNPDVHRPRSSTDNEGILMPQPRSRHLSAISRPLSPSIQRTVPQRHPQRVLRRQKALS